MFRYRQIRIGLITLTLGLATVWNYEAHKFGVWEVPVALPEASDIVIAVEPTTRAEMGWGGSGWCGTSRGEFIGHYMKRSNVETTFHMLKSKYGSLLKSKTFEAQKNEALCKVICHNISCLIHAVNEFGIEI